MVSVSAPLTLRPTAARRLLRPWRSIAGPMAQRRRSLSGAWLTAASPLCRAADAPIDALARAWVWPVLMALLLLALVLSGIVCLRLLRREQQLRDQLSALVAAQAAPADSLPAPAPPAAASAAEAPDATATRANEHESFSYTVSHDLRAPIRVVEGFTKILKEDYGRLLDRVGNDHLDRVLGAAARMNSMIDALLALSQLSSQPLANQRVNLSQLAAYVADDLRRQWPEREVTLRIEPDMQVRGDPTLLRVVVENLLGNAWKYTGKCPHAEISFMRDAKNPKVFTVSDNGAGFDMRFADRLFGVFQRLHSASDYQGTGVGLASVRRVLRRHGGDIWAESELNQGARFHFTVEPCPPGA
jgi:signal transduction histidine kinase